jgi:hypothetical protein
MTDDSTETSTRHDGPVSGDFRQTGRHPLSRRVVGPDGTVYDSISHATQVTRISRPAIAARLGDPSSGWRPADSRADSGDASPVRLAGPEAATVIAALHAYAAVLGQKPARGLRPVLGSLVSQGQVLDALGALRMCRSLAVTPGLYELAERLAVGRDVPVEPQAGPGSHVSRAHQVAPEDEVRHSSEPVGLNADD